MITETQGVSSECASGHRGTELHEPAIPHHTDRGQRISVNPRRRRAVTCRSCLRNAFSQWSMTDRGGGGGGGGGGG